MAAQGAAHGTALVADEQLHGKGRLGREWRSNHGNIHLSVLIKHHLKPNLIPLLCLGAAVVTSEVLQVRGARVGIKWPNDLLTADGKKVAGVLAEADTGEHPCVIVGIGLNLVSAPPLPTAGTLVSTDVPLERLDLTLALVTGFRSLSHLVSRDPGAVLDRWRVQSTTLGREVRVGDVVGVAEDIGPSGELLVRAVGGQVKRVLAGDVEMVGGLSNDKGSPSR